jgi:hypothetical protein
MATTPPTTGNPTIDAALVQIANSIDVEASAVTFANNVPGWITAAVNAALANGATAAQLAPVTQLAATLKTNADALAAAITADSPVAAALAMAKAPPKVKP